MIIDALPPQTVNIYRENCPSIFSETELLISKFTNIALHNALQSSCSGSRSGKLDWTGRAHKRPSSQINKQQQQSCQGSYWYLLNGFHLLFYKQNWPLPYSVTLLPGSWRGGGEETWQMCWPSPSFKHMDPALKSELEQWLEKERTW